MNRHEFRKLFKCVGPVVLPVIHVLDNAQAERNVRVLAVGSIQSPRSLALSSDRSQALASSRVRNVRE